MENLTENQILLIKLFKQLKMSEESVIGTMLLLKTDKQVLEMMNYIKDNKENLNKDIIIKQAIKYNQITTADSWGKQLEEEFKKHGLKITKGNKTGSFIRITPKPTEK